MDFPKLKMKPADWDKLLGAGICDPDGWRGSLAQSWDTPITLSEFMARMVHCSVDPRRRNETYHFIREHAVFDKE
jgi:hypothetical protein